MKTKLFAALMVLSFAATSAHAASSMKEGMWDISTAVEMPGLPFQPPPMTISHCYTKEELQDQNKMVPEPEKECKVTNLKTSNSKVTWQIVCTGKNAAKGEGEIIFKGDSAYEGTMKMETEGMTMTSRYKAKRTGPCK
jgi:hypothetical protein